MPECRYRASIGVFKPGFPLKACGNDNRKLSFSIGQSELKVKLANSIKCQQNLESNKVHFVTPSCKYLKFFN